MYDRNIPRFFLVFSNNFPGCYHLFKFHGCDHIWGGCVGVGVKPAGVKGLETRGQNDGAYVDGQGLGLLRMCLQRNCLGFARLSTLP